MNLPDGRVFYLLGITLTAAEWQPLLALDDEAMRAVASRYVHEGLEREGLCPTPPPAWPDSEGVL